MDCKRLGSAPLLHLAQPLTSSGATMGFHMELFSGKNNALFHFYTAKIREIKLLFKGMQLK